jgi:hypothetical protein
MTLAPSFAVLIAEEREVARANEQAIYRRVVDEVERRGS